jgi:hypothetical protein
MAKQRTKHARGAETWDLRKEEYKDENKKDG